MPAASEPIVVNTGPLIAPAACDALDVLGHLHSHVLVPTAVVEAFSRGRSGWAGSTDVPAWLDVRALVAPVPPLLVAHLDSGEASAIALALEAHIRLVAIDERRGRLVARSQSGKPLLSSFRERESFVFNGRFLENGLSG